MHGFNHVEGALYLVKFIELKIQGTDLMNSALVEKRDCITEKTYLQSTILVKRLIPS